MNTEQERQRNQDFFRQIQQTLGQIYPAGRFVAIAGGRIVADAAHFEELDSILNQMGNRSPDVLVVQAGVDYPETVTIFMQDLRQ